MQLQSQDRICSPRYPSTADKEGIWISSVEDTSGTRVVGFGGTLDICCCAPTRTHRGFFGGIARMFSTFTFGIEMIVCFVLLDFLLGLRWIMAAAGVVLVVIATMLPKKDAAGEKQGGYGKVVVFKESLVRQLLRPMEVVAMIKCKFGAIGTSRSGLAYGLESLELNEDDVAFCSEKLKQVSRSFATVITFLPNRVDSPLRLAVAVFYLVLRALDTVEDDMDLNRFDECVLKEDKTDVADARLVAKQRLLRTFAKRLEDSINGDCKQKRLVGFGEGNEKELLDNIDQLVNVMGKLPKKLQVVILSITQEMGEGMADYIARDLKNGTDDEVDFEKYCHVAAGTVGDGLTRLFAVAGYCPSSLVLRNDLWDSMGSFLQRTNIIRDYLEDLVDGRAWWPRSCWSKFVPKSDSRPESLAMLAEISSIENGQSVRCLNQMICDALVLVPKCIEYLEALDEPSVISFCALPQVMAIATLAECYANEKVFRGVVKIRKGLAAKIMLDLAPINGKTTASIRASYLGSFKEFITIIQQKSDHCSDEKVYQLCGKLSKQITARQEARQTTRD
uniref:Squalene synthase n=1 Tax=Mucochytrium quahogii TaxID=96639 RepID=A0A7S2R6R2_9STRA